MSASALYDEVIMDHIRDARNYRALEPPAVAAEATNPLCGDAFQVYVDLQGERLAAVSFQCECCGISMASASMMTEAVQGRTRAQALALRDAFRHAVESGAADAGDGSHPDHPAMLQFVRATPARKGCVLLAWSALARALGAAA
jgi:nitrogen fixation NifU-like protein